MKILKLTTLEGDKYVTKKNDSTLCFEGQKLKDRTRRHNNWRYIEIIERTLVRTCFWSSTHNVVGTVNVLTIVSYFNVCNIVSGSIHKCWPQITMHINKFYLIRDSKCFCFLFSDFIFQISHHSLCVLEYCIHISIYKSGLTSLLKWLMQMP